MQFGVLLPRITVNLLVALMIGALPVQAVTPKLVYAMDRDHGEEYVRFINERAAEFRAATGVEIEVVAVESHREQIRLWAAAGVLPDVVDLVSDVGVDYFRMNLFADLRDFMRGETSLSFGGFLPIALTAFSAPADYDFRPGAVFALPYAVFNFIVGVNLDKLSAVGLESPNDLGAQWDWATARQYGVKLTRDLNGDGRRDEFGMWWPRWIHRWGAQFRHAGQSIYNRDFDPDKVMLDSAAAKVALRYMVDMVQSGAVTFERSDFDQGRAGLTYNAQPNFGNWLQNANATFAADHAPFPRGPSGANGTEFTAFGTAISRTAANPKLAWQWLKFLWGDTASVLRFSKATQFVPALRSVIDRYSKEVNVATAHANLVLAVSEYPGSGLRPIVRDTTVHNIIEEWVHKALDGQVPAEQALAEAQRLASARLSETRAR